MRRTRHRRRFHTDRVVAKRRAFIAERLDYLLDVPSRTGYGKLADRHPLDCGRRCMVCHGEKFLDPRRARETRAWRRDWDA